MAKLPEIGFTATVLGVNVFNKNYDQIISRIAGINNAVKQLDKTNSQVWPSIASTGVGATALLVAGVSAATAAVATLGATAVTSGAKFAQEMANVSSVSNATADDIVSLGDTMYTLGTQVDVSMNQSAEAVGHLVRAGIEVTDVMAGALEAVTNFSAASAGELGMEKASLLVAGALTTFNMKGTEAERVVNALTAAAVRSSITFNDVYRSFQQVAAVAASSGFDINEVSAAIGVLGRSYLRGSDAGTSFKQMLIALMKPSRQAMEAMKKYGISLFDASGDTVSLRTLIGRLQEAFSDEAVAAGKVTEAERKAALSRIFGSDAIRSAIPFANQGVKVYDEMVRATYELTAAQIAQQRTNTAAAQFTILYNTLHGVFTLIGTQVEPVFRKLLKQINFVIASVKPEKIRAFGDAFKAILTGEGFGSIAEEFDKLFGEDFSAKIKPWVDAFTNVRNAIVNQLIPSIVLLVQSVSGIGDSFGGANNILTSFINGLASVISTISKMISGLAYLVRQVQSSAAAMWVLNIAVKGLSVLPLISMIVVVRGLAGLIYGLVSPFGKVVIAAGLLITAFELVRDNWENIITQLSNLFPAVLVPAILVGAVAVKYFASVLIGTLWTAGILKVVSGIGYMVASLNNLRSVLATSTVLQFANSLVVATVAVLKFAASLVAVTMKAIVNFVGGIVFAIGDLIILGITSAATATKILVMAIAADIAAIRLGGLRELLFTVQNYAIAAGKGLVTLAKGFYNLAASVVTGTIALIRYTAQNVILIVKSIPGLILALYKLVSAFVAAQVAAVRAAIATATAWVAGLLPAIVAGFSVVIAAIAPFIVGVLAIAGVAVLVSKAWSDNWGNIQGITKKVLDWVAGKIEGFINWVKSMPLIGGFVDGVVTSFNDLKGQIPSSVESAKESIESLWKKAQEAFPAIANIVGLSTDSMNSDLQELIANIDKARLAVALMEEVQTDFFARGGVQRGEGTDWNAGISFPPMDESDTESAADRLKALIALVKQLLSDFPLLTDEAAEFIAKLEQATPGRLNGMISALRESRAIMDQLIIAQRDLLSTALQLEAVNRRIASINAEIAVINASQRVSELAHQSALLSLKQRGLQLDIRINELRSQLAPIERRINNLQRENLNLARQRIEAEIELLPLKNQVEDIEKQIAALHRVDYDKVKERAELDLDSLLIKQQIEDVENRIADVTDRRLALERQGNLLAEQLNKLQIDKQIRKVSIDLEAAWASMNVPEIIRLEALKQQLEDSLTPVQDRIDSIREEQEETQLKDDIVKNGLEKEKLALEELLDPITKKIDAIQREADVQAAKNAIIEAGLSKEKQALEDLMEPIQNRIDSINRTAEAQRLQNELAINGLEAQKRAIEDLLGPLEEERQRITDATTALQLQIEIESVQFAQQKLQWEQRLAQAELERASLELTRVKQQVVWLELMAQYIDSLTASQAFTRDEAIEVAKRLGLWDEQIGKLIEVAVKFSDIEEAARRVKQAIDDIPPSKTIDIYINQHGGTPSYAKGGTVPGPLGRPMLVIAHGGERFLGIGRSVPAQVDRAESASVVNQTIYNDNRINVEADYTRTQEPVTLGMDLRAIIGMTRR